MGDDLITLSECTEEGLAFFSVHGEKKADVLRRFHLYKAAPDLLKALKGALNALELFAEGDRSDEARNDAAKRAKIAVAAIAKAEQP